MPEPTLEYQRARPVAVRRSKGIWPEQVVIDELAGERRIVSTSFRVRDEVLGAITMASLNQLINAAIENPDAYEFQIWPAAYHDKLCIKRKED